MAASIPPFSFKNEQWSRRLPPFREPEEIGSFSLTGPHIDNYHREYHDDRRGLRPLQRQGPKGVVRNLSLELNRGFGSYVARVEPHDPSKREHLEHLLRWILHHPNEFLKIKPSLDVICWRGRLHNLLTTPYEQSDGFIICACLVDGVVYLTDFPTPAMVQKKEERDQKQEKFMYWGYKFEHYMTTSLADSNELNTAVNNFDGFHTVLTSKLGNINLLYGAEMDCYDPECQSVKPPKCYVELKTSRKLDNAWQMRSFCDQKMRKWWAQSIMGGVPLIVVGFRDDKGVVIYTDEMQTANMQNQASGQGANWSAAVCMNFLADFLQYIRGVVVEDYQKAIYKFEWNPGWTNVTAEKVLPNSEYKFIPSWFLDSRPR